MIDCQQSEENAIRAIFPDSVVYLCAFHRLQAWLWWIVKTKNGVSNYQTYCMGLLRAMGGREDRRRIHKSFNGTAEVTRMV